MKEFETIKMYGKRLNVWKHMVTVETLSGHTYEEERTSQIELAYNEYDANGELIRKGSEDFSVSRYNDALKDYRVFTWDGKKVNKGGCRWFYHAMTIRINRKDRHNALNIVKGWFPEAAAVELR